MTTVTAQIVHLSSALLPLLLIFPIAALTALRWALRTTDANGDREERDWSIPEIDATGRADSCLHRWDVRCKIATLLLFALLTVSLTSLWPTLAALLVSIVAIWRARLPWRNALRRVAAMTGFLSMFLLIMPLTAVTRPADVVLIFGQQDWFTLNLRGLELALLVSAKAIGVALLMEPLLATAPLPRTLAGLSRLGVPRQITLMILLAHRYIFVFLHEARRMATGMEVRGFRKRTDLDTVRTTGNFLGMLFVRSYERTQRVYAAMLVRGFNGTLPDREEFSLRPADWLISALWLCTGLILLAIDRLLPTGAPG